GYPQSRLMSWPHCPNGFLAAVPEYFSVRRRTCLRPAPSHSHSSMMSAMRIDPVIELLFDRTSDIFCWSQGGRRQRRPAKSTSRDKGVSKAQVFLLCYWDTGDDVRPGLACATVAVGSVHI